ncbi:MAG: xylan 1,4-beta-xylosidase [Chloroflexota bacterium]|nr:xylan 1,4-beta-xylosidase [Chloroflexota bacterium]
MTGRAETRSDAADAATDRVDARHESDAQADWERRRDRKTAEMPGAEGRKKLPAPAGARAVGAVGHIRLSWHSVPGAAGYLIERTEGHDGQPGILDHGGSDVRAVSTNAFANTGVRDDVEYSYRIGAVAGAEYPAGAWSQPVSARTLDGPAGLVEVRVDASKVTGRLNRVWHMVGSERLSQLCLSGDEQWIGTEFASALRLAHDDLGVTVVRAHAILHDDNTVVQRDRAGRLQFSFHRVDAIYDQLINMGIRPVVELSFMPSAMARDPKQGVFTYKGIISPPANWGEWRELIAALATHLVQRYGIEEVAQWSFEVWNEPNLEVFWSGTKEEYLRLYDESVRAIKSVDPRLRVGGPSTAAAEWVDSFAAHAADEGVALDFVSTHTYGNFPLDVRPSLSSHGFKAIPIWWTEWGVASTHFGPIHDGVMGAPFVLSGFAAAQGRLDALSYWVVSDHFEELGRPPRLFHNGFGLLSVGNLRKPRYWAVHLAAHLGGDVLEGHVRGDGADVLVQAWATRHTDGTVDVLMWNGTINAALLAGDPRLDRKVRLIVTGLGEPEYRVTLARIDEQHSNVVALCPDEVTWPDEALWAQLRAHDELYEEHLPDIARDRFPADLNFVVPMPGVVRIRLIPAPSSRPTRTEKESQP